MRRYENVWEPYPQGYQKPLKHRGGGMCSDSSFRKFQMERREWQEAGNTLEAGRPTKRSVELSWKHRQDYLDKD